MRFTYSSFLLLQIFLLYNRTHTSHLLSWKSWSHRVWVTVKKLFTSMAALSSFFKRKSSIPLTRWFSTQPILESPSFSRRIRDLPKDLPGTNIKKEVSQVFLFSSSLFFPFVDYFSNKCVWWARKQRKATVNSLISAIRSGNDVVLNFSVSLNGVVSDFLRFGCSWFFWAGRDFFVWIWAV